jgi:cyclophilin family peptidyl-prolyl cis-trans isomerase/HEAT repeat protein
MRRFGYLVWSVMLTSASCGWFGGGGERLPSSRDSWVDAILAAEDRRDADDPLLAIALERDDPVVRMFAYRAFGRIGDGNKIALVLNSARRERESALRAEAIYAIGATESSRVLDAVEEFALDPSPVARRAVARAIGRTNSEDAAVRLFELLSDPAAEVRAEAAYGLARRLAADRSLVTERSLPVFKSLAETALRDSDPTVRAATAYALSKVEHATLAPGLAQALSDSDPTVRAFAAQGLQSIDYDAAVRTALIVALSDPEYLVVVEAAKALQRSGALESVIALASQLPSDDSPGHASHQVRASAAKALRSATGDGERPIAVTVLRRPAALETSPSVLADALDSFVALASPDEALAACAKYAAEREAPAAAFLRSRAAAAAAAIAGEVGYPIVKGLLADSDAAVKAAALATLPRFPTYGAETSAALEAALSYPDVAPREAAANAIAEMRLESLAPKLAMTLAESTGPEFIEARLAILKAIGSFQKFTLTNALEIGLDDDEPEVRRVAADQIARVGGLLPQFAYRAPPPAVTVARAGHDFLTGDPRPRVEVVTTQGKFVLEMLVEDAPVHAKVFLERCRRGFYDGLSFHRMVPGFVVQGLDPRGDGYGTGGPSLRAETNEHRYGRGSVGMPDAGKDTGGCQIFVTFRAQPRLDDRYTIFARVVEGMENVERLDIGDRVLYVLAPAE